MKLLYSKKDIQSLKKRVLALVKDGRIRDYNIIYRHIFNTPEVNMHNDDMLITALDELEFDDKLIVSLGRMLVNDEAIGDAIRMLTYKEIWNNFLKSLLV